MGYYGVGNEECVSKLIGVKMKKKHEAVMKRELRERRDRCILQTFEISTRINDRLGSGESASRLNLDLMRGTGNEV